MSVLCRLFASAALCLVPGCFTDDGAVLTGSPTSATSTTTSTASTSSDATTDAPARTTTGEPEPGTTTTGEPTTGELTGTTAPACLGECEPGEVMDLGLCEPCGRLGRTCQPDCTWAADACVEDRSTCTYWYVDDGAKSWQRVGLPQPPPEHAPTAPVIAAFDLAAHDRIFALTTDTFHVLSGADQTWIASGPREALLPGVVGELLQAYAIFSPDIDQYVVYAVSDPNARIYTLAPDATAAQFMQSNFCCNSFTDFISPPALTAVRDLFVDMSPPFPWTGSLGIFASCEEELLPLSQYAGWVTPTDIYYQDISWCFEMVSTGPLAGFAPFAAPGAPPGERIGGVAMLGERLYVFDGE